MYEDSNVVMACQSCNFAKGGWTEKEFVSACKSIVEFQTTGNSSATPHSYKRYCRTKMQENNTQADGNYTLNDETWHGHQCFTKAKRGTLSDFRFEANRKGRVFSLTQAEFDDMIKGRCHYCGVVSRNHIGIDRFNNEEDYIASNCVACCTACNFMKRNMSSQEFFRMVEGVAKND